MFSDLKIRSVFFPRIARTGSIRYRKMAWRVLCLYLGSLGAQAMEPWNAPYDRLQRGSSVLFSTFQISPRHLDPASSYSENEAQITGQIYEPPLQYHYLQRPYTLVPLTLRELPKAKCFDRSAKALDCRRDAGRIKRVVYRLHLLPGIRFAPHPAFARDANGVYRYHQLTSQELSKVESLGSFRNTGTRELVADDYVYQIKRLAHPGLHSPILGLMSGYIEGLDALAQSLRERQQRGESIDLRRESLAGAKVIDRHTFEISLSSPYPQFVYWLAMPFFAPVPWEAEVFYGQSGMSRRNLSLDWFPVGTGPYMLVENNPNRRMRLRRNPLFRGEAYPSQGSPEDLKEGLLEDAGKAMPFIDEVHFMLEKEDIPEWTKFLQGYYDTSPIAPDGFDQAVRFGAHGLPEVTPAMVEQQIRLSVATQMSINYLGFNMLDPVVGGVTTRARALRQALSIAVDMEEMISIFGNGRGIPAQGPLPPGISGFREGEEGTNPWVYRWHDGRAQRRPVAEAEALLRRAGYPAGVDPATGRPLQLFLDATTTGPDMNALFDWYRKQFSKLGIELVVRSTDYNRFQEKMLKGHAQIFTWGWNADYPDAENFLFLLYGPHGKVRHQGENAANYASPRFDALFRQMKILQDGPARKKIIDEMVALVRRDSPWIWGFHPQAYVLEHAWMGNAKPNLMARNSIKYRRLNADLRVKRQAEWNTPILAPALGSLCALGVLVLGLFVRSRRRTMAA
jgi:ABC-type transport system substrate-binding protein